MSKANDMSRCLAALEQDSTIIGVVELSLRSWPVAGIVPGLERHPLKKLYQPDAAGLFLLLQRWREEASKAGRTIKRIAVAFEAGRDGFWLARWAAQERHRSLCHSPDQCLGVARASASEERQT
jgi:transposase